MKARNGKTKRQKKSKILIRIDERIVHECPSLSSLRPKKKENQKIKYKFNLEYNERTQILDNERDYYGNRFGPHARCTDCINDREVTLRGFNIYQCDDDQRPIGFSFLERRRLLRPHVSSFRC